MSSDEGGCVHNGYRDNGCAGSSLLNEATSLINGDRREAYGDYNVEAPLVAAGWEALRRGGSITPTLVPLMMIWLKMVRESHKPKADNRVDISGYLQLLDQLHSKP